jgi:DNA processing protein
MKSDLPYYIALAAAPGIGPVRFKLLLSHFKTAQAVWKAPEKILQRALTPSVFKQLIEFRKSFDIERYLEITRKLNIRVITIEDESYPKLLKEISDAPPVLYVKGELPSGLESELKPRTIAVVGTRKMTGYGREVTEILVGI